MRGHLEPLAGVLRIGGAYGEPYTWSAAVRFLSPTEIEILGALRAPTRDERVAMGDVLRAHGVEWLTFVRLTDGRRHRIAVPQERS